MTTQKEIRWLLDEKYGGKRTSEAEKDIARLERGEHLDYVIGWVNFADCKIDLSCKPLIPRPETEYWVGKVLEDIHGRLQKRNFGNRLSLPLAITRGARPHPRLPKAGTGGQVRFQNLFPVSSSVKVLDLFSGSGCIGVAVLKHVPNVTVDFAEKEIRFLEQIKINAEQNSIDKGRYRIFQSDIFSGVQDTYDYILANPPYVAEDRKENVQQSVLKEEPYDAVFGGKDGLEYIGIFLKEVKNYLVSGGVVYLEFDSWQREEVEKLAATIDVSHVDMHKDQFGNWRYGRIVFN